MSSSPAGVVTYRGAVYATHCDHIGHMNIASYGAKFDEANWVFFCEIGLTPSYLRGECYGMAGVQQNISYKRELFAGDIIEVTSKLLELRDKSIRFLHEMRAGEGTEVAATTILTAVHLDTKARKAIAFPDEVKSKAQALTAL